MGLLVAVESIGSLPTDLPGWGIIGALAVLLVRELIKDRDHWRDIALEMLPLVDKVAAIAEDQVGHHEVVVKLLDAINDKVDEQRRDKVDEQRRQARP